MGAGAGLVLSAAIVSYALWTTPTPLHPALSGSSRPAPAPGEDFEPPALAEGSLEFPVLLLSRVRLQDSFRHPRANGERTHHAVDIMAPRYTPVRAVSDGVITRASDTGAGGRALYQVDPTGGYCFYYAHLEGYAPGVEVGRKVRRGEVIGYVGSTGNAPESAPHLHFAIYQLRDRKRWWGGRPVNPYPLLKLSAHLDADRPS
ncbi:MAG TPA: M23 family metallopeptidase [Vicinamibacteria bacterium]|nr:M23 family metallopeptidase [Vicinamibacteria bacterium]